MPTWNPQRYRFRGARQGVPDDVLDAAIHINERIRRANPQLPTILTLRHLSVLSDTTFRFLNRVVSREDGHYKQVLFRKKVPGRSRYRQIHIPEEPLLRIQSWITDNILRNTNAHPASFAYHPGSQPVYAAMGHCGCKWLLKVDIEDFFHSISEGKVFLTFGELGYPRLLSFELSRITTMTSRSDATMLPSSPNRWTAIPRYKSDREGFLPQGAPSSPMLSNLVMKRVDEQLTVLATSHGFKYTRYADDLAFSTEAVRTIETMKRFKRMVLSALLTAGFKHNRQKTVIRGPGARRIILGILVDGAEPRLAKEFRDRIRQHLYYLRSSTHGPSKHATARNVSVSTLYHHIRGKIAWAERIEPKFRAACLSEFETVAWPPFDAYR
jgi:RNA-directed DNA polymerase